MHGFDLKVLGLEFRPMIFRKDLNALILYCVTSLGLLASLGVPFL